ncbi:MAG TPA: cytochrome c3 family protein [Candidatus Methylomirabilis sp.]|nr:cytochrome c3 family protein [Candidatus Methylomirabilis sp.]
MRFDRNTLLLIFITVAFLAVLFLINQEAKTIDYMQQTYVKKTEETAIIDQSANQSTSNYTIMVPRDVCEGCHTSGKPFIPQALTVEPHQNGGAFCLSCHVISHEKHPINQNVTCEKCHSTGPTKPAYVNGYIPCNDCHNYPDALIPSNGNLITIHKQRGISCNTCHTDSCTKCHSDIGTSERWIKRLDHFKLVAIER